MVLLKSTLAAGTVLAGSLRLTGAFFGCGDSDPAPAPAIQNQTHTEQKIDVGDIVKNKQPGEKVIIITAGAKVSEKAGASVGGDGAFELAARVDVSGGGTFVYVGHLVVEVGKVLFAGGHAMTPVYPSQQVVNPIPAQPLPRHQYRQWRSPEIDTVVMSAQTIQEIELANEPLRFAFSLPYQTPQEFNAGDVVAFWVEALDAAGNNVMPAGAELVSTPQVVGEWPMSSAILWPSASLPVMSISLDVVNADGSNVTPSQLGCGLQSLRFRVGMSSSDSKANWDFGWCAGLWRTESDISTDGDGMWLGWHAASFDALAPLNGPPQIVSVTDLLGTPITSLVRGASIKLTVNGGFVPSSTEIAVDGYSMPVVGYGPGSNPSEVVYTLVVPTLAQTGPWSLFFRNIGATMASNPGQVPQVVSGFDYVPVTVR